jgi:superfamily II DNA helicase RecQ
MYSPYISNTTTNLTSWIKGMGISKTFFYFCYQNGVCRRNIILQYFNSGSAVCSDNLKCDCCQSNLETSIEDISDLACNIIVCLPSMKTLNCRKFTLKRDNRQMW